MYSHLQIFEFQKSLVCWPSIKEKKAIPRRTPNKRQSGSHKCQRNNHTIKRKQRAKVVFLRKKLNIKQELKRTNSMHRAFSQKDRSAWLLFLLLCKDVQPPVVAVVNFIAFSVCARSADGHRIFPSSSTSPSSLYYDG